MLIFDEEAYAKDIYINGYKTVKYQGLEKAVLVRYLNNLGYNKEQILDILISRDVGKNKFINTDIIENMCKKVINKALLYEYIANPVVVINKSQMNYINSVENEKLKVLMFIYTVYYEWAKNIKSLSIKYKKDPNPWVLENDIDCFKLAKLQHDRNSYKNSMINKMIKLNIYESKIINGRCFFRMSFFEESVKPYFTITRFDNLRDLALYNPETDLICEKCKGIVKRASNSQKYCKKCANEIKIQQTVESRNA